MIPPNTVLLHTWNEDNLNMPKQLQIAKGCETYCGVLFYHQDETFRAVLFGFG